MKRRVTFLRVLWALLVIFGLGVPSAYAQSGQIGINQDTPQATIDIKATSNGSKAEGMLIPRLTGDEIKNMPTANIATSTMIYATSAATGSPLPAHVADLTAAGYYFYNGTKWVRIEHSEMNSAEWKDGSNATGGTTTNYIYANQAKTAGEDVVITDNGRIGIGTAVPTFELDVRGNVLVRGDVDNSSYVMMTKDGSLELLRKNMATAPETMGYLDFKNESTHDADVRFRITEKADSKDRIFTIENSSTGDITNTNSVNIPMSFNLTQAKMGIGTSAPAHTLHVKATADPLRLEGLQIATSTETTTVVVADANGVLKSKAAIPDVPNSIGNNVTIVGSNISLGVSAKLYTPVFIKFIFPLKGGSPAYEFVEDPATGNWMLKFYKRSFLIADTETIDYEIKWIKNN